MEELELDVSCCGEFFSTAWTQLPAASSRTVTVLSPVGLARE